MVVKRRKAMANAFIVDTPGKAALYGLKGTIGELLQLVDVRAFPLSVRTGVIFYEYRVTTVRGELLNGFIKPPGRAIHDLQETVQGIVGYMDTHKIPIPSYLVTRIRYYKISIALVRHELKTLV